MGPALGTMPGAGPFFDRKRAGLFELMQWQRCAVLVCCCTIASSTLAQPPRVTPSAPRVFSLARADEQVLRKVTATLPPSGRAGDGKANVSSPESLAVAPSALLHDAIPRKYEKK